MELYHLIYTSYPAKLMDENALQELLTVSREANIRFGITGILLYFPENFIQLIEGPKGHIEQLYDNIQRDSRHLRVTTLREGAITRRFFPDWSMAFEKSDLVKPDSDSLSVLDQKVLQLFGIMGL